MKKTIISFTPLALEKDSRTLKMAISFVRFGYRSVVVEQIKSEPSFAHLGIETISIVDNSFVPSVRESHSLKKYIFFVLKKILKCFWEVLRKIGLGSVNDTVSYLLFKRHFKKLYSFTPTLVPKANIYCFHSYEYVDFALRLPSDAKVIYDAHDFYQEINPIEKETRLVKRWLIPFKWRLERKLINRSDVFSTVSPGLAKKYKQCSGKIPFVIMNAHDYRNDIDNSSNVRSFLNLKANDLIMCCVGNKKRGMIFDQLINVVGENFPNIHLVFIGGGYDNDRSVHPHIHFIPTIHPNKLVPFVKTANFGIIPYFCFTENYKFALPNGFFQMTAAELPIVFSHSLVEIAQLNKQYSFGITANIQSEKELKSVIEKMIHQYECLKIKVIESAKELSWSTEEQKLKKLINYLEA